ncbi:MAG: hypothetical protein JWP27_1292 [Flaviaesturariibacter sp.]|nr:hypothetical protein [Flaviaesturariibacter sp.]
MKKLSLFILAAVLTGMAANAQTQNRKTFKINPGERIMDVIPRTEALSAPGFGPGTIYFRNGRYAKASLLYNYLIPGLQFINEKGDTLMIDNEKDVRYAVLGSDTFYYDHGFLRLVQTYPDMLLAEKRYFSFSNRQKLGGMGEVTSASIDTYTSVSSDNYYSEIVAREILTLSRYKYLYIGDKYNNFTVVNKKSLLDLYPGQERAVLDYLKENKVDYSDTEAIKKLIAHFSAKH